MGLRRGRHGVKTGMVVVLGGVRRRAIGVSLSFLGLRIMGCGRRRFALVGGGRSVATVVRRIGDCCWARMRLGGLSWRIGWCWSVSLLLRGNHLSSLRDDGQSMNANGGKKT